MKKNESNQITNLQFNKNVLDMLISPELNVLRLDVSKVCKITGKMKPTIYKWLRGECKEKTVKEIEESLMMHICDNSVSNFTINGKKYTL